MKRLFRGSTLVTLIIMFSGCASFHAKEYKSDYKSIELLKEKHSQNQVFYRVNAFTNSMKDPKTLSCRAGDTFTLKDDESFPKYIENALIEEMDLAKVLNSSGVAIGVHFDNIELNSTEGSWTFKGRLIVAQKTTPFEVKYNFYATYFQPAFSCSNAENSFPDAVDTLLKFIYQNLNKQEPTQL